MIGPYCRYAVKYSNVILYTRIYVITYIHIFILPAELDEKTKKPGRKERTGMCGKEPKGRHARKVPSSTKLVLEYECEKERDFIEVRGDRFVYCYEKQWQGTPLECRRKNSYIHLFILSPMLIYLSIYLYFTVN